MHSASLLSMPIGLGAGLGHGPLFNLSQPGVTTGAPPDAHPFPFADGGDVCADNVWERSGAAVARLGVRNAT
jgi:hypothetical protein